MAELLRTLVNMESPTDDPGACCSVQRLLGERLRSLGGVLTEESAADGSPVLLARFGAQREPVLLLGHVDTVWPTGELHRRPYTVEGAIARGPGVFDMKAGLVQMLFALRELTEPDVTVLLNADEEIGSPGSQEIIRREASRSRCALVLEPSGAGGAMKTARKGIGFYRIDVRGKAAHPGLDFADGVNAIVELAGQVVRLAALTDEQAGTTVNVGTVGGGTGRNVVPEHAVAEFESRFSTLAEGERVDEAVRTLSALDPRSAVTVSGSIHRAPMLRTSVVAELAALANSCAQEHGWQVGEISAGGVSDGNLTSAAGLPTLDGMGAVGGGAHSVDEHVRLDELPRRAVWLARLIEQINRR